MAISRKTVFLLALAFVALVFVALIVLVTWTWESPALTSAVLSALSSDDLQVDTSRVRLSVLRGIVLDDVVIKTRLDGGRLEANARELILEHRLLGLLGGKIQVHQLRMVAPSIAVAWDAPAKPGRHGSKATVVGAGAAAVGGKATSQGAEAGGGWALAIGVDEIAIEDGSLVMTEENVEGEMVRFEGLSVRLKELYVPADAASLVRGLAAKGEISARRLAVPSLVAEGVQGSLSIRDGHLVLSPLHLPTSFGTLTVPRLDLDLVRDPYEFELSVEGAPLKTAALLGASSGFGDSSLEVALRGDGSPRGGPRGQGNLRVAAGTLGALPLLSAVEVLLIQTDLVGRPYESFTIPFELNGDYVDLHSFTIVAGNLSLMASGRIDLNGPLDLHLEIAMPRQDVGVKEIPVEVLEALTDVDGRVKLPILIAGTLDQPAVRFDSRAWGRLLGRRAVDEGLRWLTKKLGG